MKKAFLVICLAATVLPSIAQSAGKDQTSAFESAILPVIAQLDTASVSTLQVLANDFDKIAKTAPARWEPLYYAAYCYTFMAFRSPDKTKIDGLADMAEEHLNKAKALEPNNSEISCMEAMVISARILVDRMGRYPSMGRQVTAKLEEAKTQNPNNPRAYLHEARMQANLPEMLGGGTAVAKETLGVALAKFDTFIPGSPVAPSWGKMQAKMLLEKLNAE